MSISDWSSDVCSSDLPKRCFNHAQIVSATGRSAKSIDWGLLFLRQCDLVESFPDRRNTRYLVYRITQTPQPTPAWAIKQEDTKRSEARRVGKECVSTLRYGWSPVN